MSDGQNVFSLHGHDRSMPDRAQFERDAVE